MMLTAPSMIKFDYGELHQPQSILRPLFLTYHEYVDSLMVTSCPLTRRYLSPFFYIPVMRSSSLIAASPTKNNPVTSSAFSGRLLYLPFYAFL